ncbi:unnamed protein product [Echinostoma caproni]|uniref:DUF2126 domain-containing protein n=1 Tax=Echinostoma caproni TaxID=27848 RepID=A0A183BAQ7_9TREM|nr:unnamed protein product [Echinostoma caproni]
MKHSGAYSAVFQPVHDGRLQAAVRFHVRPRLEYGGAATYPCTAGELDKLERLQRAATRLFVGLRGTSYEGRLQATGLEFLES